MPKVRRGAAGPASINAAFQTGAGAAVAFCGTGQVATGGGFVNADAQTVTLPAPVATLTDPTGWQATVANPQGAVTAYVVCSP